MSSMDSKLADISRISFSILGALSDELSLNRTSNNTHSLCSDQIFGAKKKNIRRNGFLARECSKITKSAVSPVRQNQNENPANPNPPREDPPAADGQGGGRGDGQHIPRADGAEPRQDNPLEQLIGNPLFQAMARAPAVNAVGNCRLPAFWRSDPDLWFLQVEAQFNIHQVTSDSTRFNMILTVLDPETISEVSDIIRAPPAQDKYTTLKDAIVARLTDSPDTQLHKLLGTIELGDKKPSQLLLQMRTLAGARASNDILRVRWLDLLPDSTRRLLTIIKNQTIDELAAVADELHAVGPSVMATEVGRPRSRPASPGGAASSNSNSVGAQEIAELRAAIVQLTEITREALQRRDQPREARPRGTAGTTRDTATWPSSAEARACVHTPRPVRKLGVLTLHSAPAVSITIERRLYVTDRTHKIRFLIDSGSVLSILPRTVVRKPLQRKTLELQAANGTTIATYVRPTLPHAESRLASAIRVGFHHRQSRRRHHRSGSLEPLRTAYRPEEPPPLGQPDELVHIVPGRPGPPATKRAQARWPRSSTSRCNIESSRPDSPSLPALGASPAIDSQPRRPNSRSCSIGASSGLHRASGPVHCTSCRSLETPGGSRATTACSTPVLNRIDTLCLSSRDLLQESVGKVFSVVDLYKAFLPDPGRRRRHLEDGRHDTFRPLFEFVGMPLGLRNSAQTFQRTMNYLLRDLDFVRCYQDDILVLSASHEQHLQHLRELLTILKRARLFVNWEKCQIGRSEVVFAGYLISERGFEPPAAKVEAIARFPKPSDSTQLRRFIGMLNFYRRCLPRAAELMSPLTDLLRGLQKKKEKLAWGAQADEAFERIKQAMASAVRSAFYHPGQPLALHTDASNTAIGAALSQRPRRRRLDAAGFLLSQKLSPTQQRYSTYDRELLAIFEAIKYFQRILEGRSFHHHDRSSPSVLRPRAEVGQVLASTVTSARLHLALRCQDRLHARRREPSGRRSIRIDAITMPTTLNSAQISAEQQKDEQLTHLRGKAKLKLHDVVIDGLSLVCVEQRNGLKPYLPESLRRQAFDTAHTLSHPSGRATVKRVALLYFLAVDEQGHRALGEAMLHRHNRAELGNFVTPDGRFDHVHIDIVKMPLHQGFQNCLTMIDDRYTRWPQAIPIGDMSAQTVAKAFFHGWISFFGTPLTITTNQGAQFEGKLLAQLCKLVGAKHVHTSPYHPQANSMVERMHRTLKAVLKCSPETPWTLALPGVLLGLRTTFKEDLQASPAEMVFGTSLRIPGSSSHDKNRTKRRRQSSFRLYGALFQAIRPVPASRRHVQHRPFVFKDLATSDYVFRRLDTILKPLEQQPYTGPHRVIRRINERNFVVDVNGVAKTLSTPISSSQPTWMSPTAEHHRQHRSSQLPRSLHQHGESPFHSLRKLPSPLGGE
ncbi:unnamed protein product [Trichogramma brassicae]|uniref:RNA-directed DNA polymerase n=1 Tax=Trichogramma brassicae TaxID=86971 RepID=A0A6H5J776_9HYME|nr:unnamed protein product [Trichogramma brassicae]